MAHDHQTPAGQDAPALDLHALYMQQHVGGFHAQLRLYPHQVQAIAAQLRGISACSAVLVAEGDGDVLNLQPWLRVGLAEAIDALAIAANGVLERANEHAGKVQGGAV